nr:expressed conserved protein [Hymenolepis microstoma]
MNSDSPYLLPVSSVKKESERLYKFTILTPHTFLPPDHPDNLEDDLANEFAGYLCRRVHEILGSRSYIPQRSGEAFLNMRFDEFEEKFLRHSDYVIFITSGKNAASLDIIYPRMLVFLTIRPTWRSRGIVVYLGPPEGQKLFDPNLFLTKPLLFPLSPNDWISAEHQWEALFGRLQTQVPLTPEPVRTKQLTELLPINISKASTNENAVTSPTFPFYQSAAHIVEPIKTKRAKHDKLSKPKFIRLSEQGNSRRLFLPTPSLSSTTQWSPFRQLESRYSIHRSYSADDMCFYTRHPRKKSNTSKKPKEKQRRNSDSVLSKKSKSDFLCILSGLRFPKGRRKEGGKQEIVVRTPEVIQSISPEIDPTEIKTNALHGRGLQVQVEDESLNRRLTPYFTMSTSPTKRKTNMLISGSRTRTRWDSGIASNYSLESSEVSTSNPSLHLRHDLQQAATASPQSFLSTSSPSYLDGHYFAWAHSRNQKSSHSVASNHMDSSIEAQRGNDLEYSLKFADEENLSDTTILSDKSGMCGISPFIKPGIPPLKTSMHKEEEITPLINEPRLFQGIANPNSEELTISAGDSTIAMEFFKTPSDDYILQAQEESFENAIKPQVTRYEQRTPPEDTSDISDKYKRNAVEGTAINDADFVIKDKTDSIQQRTPVVIQNPMRSENSVGSCAHQSIFSSAETVIYEGHTKSMELQNPSLVNSSNHLANVQKAELDVSQEFDDANEDQTSERNYNSSPNLNSEITEKVFTPENSPETPADTPAGTSPYQSTDLQIEELLLNESISQLSRNNSLEFEEITMSGNKSAGTSLSNLKRESAVADQSNLKMGEADYQDFTTESLPHMCRNASRSFKASRDSGLHSIGGTDTTSLGYSSLDKEGLISQSEFSKKNDECSINGTQKGIVFAAEITGDHSISNEEPHQEMYALSSQNETPIMENSADSGIHSAVSTLRKSTASTFPYVTDDIDQDLDNSERIPGLVNQETIEITPYVHQNVQIFDEKLAPVALVQETLVSVPAQDLDEEILPVNKSQNESGRETEVKELSFIQPIITSTQELPLLAAVHDVNEEIVSVGQAQKEHERIKGTVDIQPIQEVPVFAVFFGKHDEDPLERIDLKEEIQDSIHRSEAAPKVKNPYPRLYLETESGIIDESSKDLSPLSLPPSEEGIKKQRIEKVQKVEKELSSSTKKRYSLDVGRSNTVDLCDKEAYEIVRAMLESCSPDTLKLAQNAVLTYGPHPKFDKSMDCDQPNPKQVIVSTTKEAQLNSEIEKSSLSPLWKAIPQFSVALINLSTAYIPRYISTIYDYSIPLIRPNHPDRNLRQLTASVQEAFLNYPLGVPVLLAGTTLISPWVIRQFPLTIMATCQEAPDILRRLFEQPGNFLAEHFSGISQVLQATPTWSAFAIIGSRSTHWQSIRPAT